MSSVMRQITHEELARMQYHCEVRTADDCPYWIAGTGVYKQPDIVTHGEHAGRYICAECRKLIGEATDDV